MFYFQSVPTVRHQKQICESQSLYYILLFRLNGFIFRCVGILLKYNISKLYVKQRLHNSCIISYYLFLFQLRHMYSTIGRKYLFSKLHNSRFPNALVFTEILMSPLTIQYTGLSNLHIS